MKNENFTKFIKNNFKKSFVINLDRRPDRYKDFCNSLPFDYNIVERFSATDGKLLKRNDGNLGEIGCHISHKRLLEIIIKDDSIKDNDLILIFEDDVFFNNTFETDFKYAINMYEKLKKTDNSVLYIGGRFHEDFVPTNFPHGWKKLGDNFFLRNKNTKLILNQNKNRGTFVLIFNKHIIKRLFNSLKNIEENVPIDSHYNNFFEHNSDIDFYEMFPHISYSTLDYKSDILRK